MRQVIWYVIAVCASALALNASAYAIAPAIEPRFWPAALSFAALGVLAHTLAHRLAQGAAGSIGFLPFLAAVLVAPSWLSIVAVTAAVAAVEFVTRKEKLKALFNSAQIALALAVCLHGYLLLGGQAIASKADISWLTAAQFLAAFLLFLITNSIAVGGVVAVSSGRRFPDVWRANTRRSLLFDFFSFPFVFVFAVVYIEYGFAGVAILALQMLGVRQLYKTNWQLEKTNQELLQLMVAAIEARDPYTSGHSRRVAEYSRIIARALGLPAKQVERISVAALLHDVGKIHENFAPILRKPTRLTDEEMAIMKTHPIKSAELVQTVSQLRDVLPIVRHHHENWDGSGYPDGLKEQAIPLGARVIMFADTIDAMTTDRPYREALGEVQVRSELVRMRGKQFDPEICDALLASPLFAKLFRDNVLSPAEPQFVVRRPSPRSMAGVSVVS
jgi:putative nucleotidyltransferase with HDIG domain